MRQAALDQPEKTWWTDSTEPETQQQDFLRWVANTRFHCADATAPVHRWLGLPGNGKEFSTDVTNEPTGAQYRVEASRYEDGADCRVKFIGNINWK